MSLSDLIKNVSREELKKNLFYLTRDPLPCRDNEYHLAGDIPERVDLENLTLSVKLIPGSVCKPADNGAGILG